MEKTQYAAPATNLFIDDAALMAADASAMARAFSRLLAVTQTLCRQSLFCHWQATESEDTYSLHSLFEHHYQALRKNADIIASRMRALGYKVPEQPAWGTRIDDTLPMQEMIGTILKGHQACAREAKKLLDLADATGDDLSAHLAAQRLAAHDQASWLLLTLLQAKTPIHSAV